MFEQSLVLRTSKKSIKDTTDKIFGDVIHTSVKKSTGFWLCLHNQILVGADERLEYNHDPDNGERDFSPGECGRWDYTSKCSCINNHYSDWNSCPSNCRTSTITNYMITFQDLL